MLSVKPQEVDGDYLVIFKNDNSASMAGANVNSVAPSLLDSLTQKYKFTIKDKYTRLLKGFSAKLGVDALKNLSKHPQIETIIKDIKIRLPETALRLVEESVDSDVKRNTDTTIINNHGLIKQPPLISNWGVKDIPSPVYKNLHQTQNLQVDSDVYIIDSGVDNHSYLNLVESVSMIKPGLFSKHDLIHGHGTHVAGIIGAKYNPQNGVAGMAPGVRIHSVRVLDEHGEGSLSWVLNGLEFVVNRRFESGKTLLVNLSLGYESKDFKPTYLDQVIDRASQLGIIFVVAAGNSHIDALHTSPAHNLNVVTVGSYNSTNSISQFSNFGKALDILAPGEDILSTWCSTNKLKYASMSGTSMAAPHITGLLALLLSCNRNLTLYQVAAFLKKYKTRAIENSLTRALTGVENIPFKASLDFKVKQNSKQVLIPTTVSVDTLDINNFMLNLF